MKIIASVTLLLLTASATWATEIRSYDLRLQTYADGSGQAVVIVRLEGSGAGPVAIPLGFAAVADLQLTEGPAGTLLVSESVNGQTLVRALLPEGAPATSTIGIAFTVKQAFVVATLGPGERSPLPAGSRMFRHAFVNSQLAPIKSYRVDVIFTDGMRVHAIREALPKLRKTEAGPRVLLGNIDGKPGATLQVDRVLQGDSASMQLELVSQSRSALWLIVGVVLSLLYLVYFRDLVASRRG